MKKVLKNISRVLFSLLLIVSIFGAFNVFAADVIFQITGISVKEKSDKVTVNDVSLSGGSINNDIVFTEKDDYITYDITIKNVTEDDYTIKSITDDNTSAYLEYTYDDLSNVKLNKGESKTFELTITYKQETSNLTISDQAVSLTLTYEKEDGTTGTETITNDDNNGTTTTDDTNTTGEVKGEQTITNPKTGDNITIYIILGLVSLTGLVITTVSKKHLQKSLMVIALVSIVAIPLGVKADSESFKISFTTNKVQNSYTELIPGLDFNLAISKLSSGNEGLDKYCEEYGDFEECFLIIDTNYTEDDDEYWYINTEITSIKKATSNQFNQVSDSLTEKNIISSNNSTVPFYIWFDNGTLYYYVRANKIFLDEDASGMFMGMTSLKTIDLSIFDTSLVTNMSSMFSGDASLEELDLSGFDTSNVTNMSSMFSGDASLEELDLSSFNTNNVISMSNMFEGCSSLLELDLSKFSFTSLISKPNDYFFVQPVEGMFWGAENLEVIYVSSNSFGDDFNAIGGPFGSNYHLVGGSGSKYIDYDDANIYSLSKPQKYFKIDGGSSNPGFLTDIADKPQN